MDNKIERLFSEEKGILKEIERAVSDFGMKERIKKGVLLGLSGGADSVLLLLYLVHLRRNDGFPLLAVHVNHGIRAEEAKRDELFSGELCKSLGVEFLSYTADVPKLAKEWGMGTEEAARKLRYSFFEKIVSEREDISAIAVAHNADDNFETVIMNMIRGSGTRGLAGISPVRDNIVRPLIYLRKKEITDALNNAGVDFVTDSTNESDDYTRNYIRHNLTPVLEKEFSNPIAGVTRMCKNLREDDECLSSMATDFVNCHTDGIVKKCELLSLKSAVLFRVLALLARTAGATSFERVHFDAISERLTKNGDFSISIPGAFFVLKGENAGFFKNLPQENENFLYPVSYGATRIDEKNALVEITKNKADFFPNVHNKSTQASLKSAIIVGDLFIRNKLSGDTCYFRGMTHKLKKLFNDRKIPTELRASIPVLCDEKGVVWIPGFGVRDDGGDEELYVRISVNEEKEDSFFLPEWVGGTSNKKGKKVT